MHDANGTALKVGDVVYIPAVITELNGFENHCNVSVKTLLGRKPDGQREYFKAINTGLMLLHQKNDYLARQPYPVD